MFNYKHNVMKTICRLSSTFLGFLLVMIPIGSCEEDPAFDPGPNPPVLTVEDVVASGDAFEVHPMSTTQPQEIAGTEETFSQNYELDDTVDQWKCTRTRVSVTGGTGEFPLYNTNASVIFLVTYCKEKPYQMPLPRTS